MTKTGYDKESVYDDEIAPLMKKIIEICKREQIPMAVQFYLQEQRKKAEYEGQPLYCTTILGFKGDSEGHEQIKYLGEVMKYGKQGKPWAMAVAITK